VTPPKFVPGDLTTVIAVEFQGRTIGTTGLYLTFGYPKFLAFGDARTLAQRAAILNDRLVGRMTAGDQCLVLAVKWYADDERWYFMLNNFKPKGLGWTRCANRLCKVNDG
jgi:hypothetical protein